MDETYGTYVDDECFAIHDYDDDTDHGTGDATDDGADDDTDNDTNDGGGGKESFDFASPWVKIHELLANTPPWHWSSGGRKKPLWCCDNYFASFWIKPHDLFAKLSSKTRQNLGIGDKKWIIW